MKKRHDDAEIKILEVDGVPVATTTDVSNAVNGLATESYADQAEIDAIASANGYTDIATTNMATTNDVSNAVSGLASETYVNNRFPIGAADISNGVVTDEKLAAKTIVQVNVNTTPVTSALLSSRATLTINNPANRPVMFCLSGIPNNTGRIDVSGGQAAVSIQVVRTVGGSWFSTIGGRINGATNVDFFPSLIFIHPTGGGGTYELRASSSGDSFILDNCVFTAYLL